MAAKIKGVELFNYSLYVLGSKSSEEWESLISEIQKRSKSNYFKIQEVSFFGQFSDDNDVYNILQIINIQSVKFLHMLNCLYDENIIEIIKSAAFGGHITSLVVSTNTLKNEYLTQIIDILKDNRTIEILYMNFKITDENMIRLFLNLLVDNFIYRDFQISFGIFDKPQQLAFDADVFKIVKNNAMYSKDVFGLNFPVGLKQEILKAMKKTTVDDIDFKKYLEDV